MITLDNSAIQIKVNPELGGSLFAFTYQGNDILRPTKPDATIPQETSMFIMLPYCSTIEKGQFNYFGISRHVPENQPGTPTPIHGDGWLAKWHVESESNTAVTLSYQHNKSTGFPFDYNAKVIYALNGNQLDITLSIHNPSDLPMPCGMGIHPYFLNPDAARLTFISSHIWHHKNDPIFDRPYPTPAEWNFEKGAEMKEDFDTAFGGWDGHASIVYSDKQLEVEISAQDIFHHLVLYRPPKADFFCLEPVSNTPDAFNLAAYGVIGTGIQSIGGGQTLTKTISITCLRG